MGGWPATTRPRLRADTSSFVVWKDTTLSPAYTPFGTVIGGMDVLQKIAAAGDDSQNNPGDGYPNLFTQFFFVQPVPGAFPGPGPF